MIWVKLEIQSILDRKFKLKGGSRGMSSNSDDGSDLAGCANKIVNTRGVRAKHVNTGEEHLTTT